MDDIDATKSSGFYVKTSKNLCNIMHSVLRNIKRLQKIPDSWKVAAITPIFKKGDRRKVENYRPVSLLNIDRKILEKCIHIALYNHFQNFLYKSQHGFVMRRSVQINKLLFLRKIYEALDRDPQSEIFVFYTDFSKAFDKVPHYELIQKFIDIGVGVCLLEILIDYLSDRRQKVRVDNTSSRILDKTSGVPQGSLLGPILFCIFINGLLDVLMFSEPFIFADHLKILAVQRIYWEVQDDLHGIENWIIQNKMELAIDKCAYLNFRGRDRQYKLTGKDLAKSTTVKDLGIHVAADVSWKQHIEERMKKANKALYMLKRNVATKVNTFVKLGLYKSLILPALPLPIIIQLNDLLLVSKALNEENSGIELPEVHSKETRNNDIFKMTKTRTEKARSEFTFKTCRIANCLENLINLREPSGLKNRILRTMRNFFEKKFSERNICTWQLFCDCENCRNYWTLIQFDDWDFRPFSTAVNPQQQQQQQKCWEGSRPANIHRVFGRVIS